MIDFYSVPSIRSCVVFCCFGALFYILAILASAYYWQITRRSCRDSNSVNSCDVQWTARSVSQPSKLCIADVQFLCSSWASCNVFDWWSQIPIWCQGGGHDVISRMSVISNRIGVKFSRYVLQVNVHQLTESDLWFDVTHSSWRPSCYFTQKTAVTWQLNMKHLPSTYAATYASSWPIVDLYLYNMYTVFQKKFTPMTFMLTMWNENQSK